MEFFSGILKVVGLIFAALFGLTYFQALTHENLESPGRSIPVTQEQAESGSVFSHFMQPLTELLGLVGLTGKPTETNLSMPVMYPIDGNFSISSGFGTRIDPFNGNNTFHNGIDIPLKRGTPIRAAGGGKVTDTGYHPRLGYFIEIAHEDYFKSIYGHLSKITVREGQEIMAGQVIGYSGNSGRSSGPHLHFQINHRGKPCNPQKIIPINNNLQLRGSNTLSRNKKNSLFSSAHFLT